MNVDELMREIKEDVTRRRGPRAAQDQVCHSDVVSSPQLTPHWMPAGTRLGTRESYTVGDFVALNDTDFVETCYRVLLRRPADVVGLNAALVDLRGGFRSKLEILGDIRFSDEGMARCVHVNGLLLPFKFQKWARSRFLGHFLGWILSSLRLPVLLRRIDATQARDARETHILGGHVNQLQIAMELAIARCRGVADAEISALRATLSTQIGLSATALKQQVNDYAARVDRLQEMLDASDKRVQKQLDQHSAQVSVDFELLTESVLHLKNEAILLKDKLQIDANSIERNTNDIREIRGRAFDEERRAFRANIVAPMALAESRMSTPGDASSVSQIALPSVTSHDALYASLEDQFRGSRDDIKERSSYYLNTVKSALAETGSGTIIDLGCGRGEWLDVLAEQGLQGIGVDLNKLFVAECMERNLKAIYQDALEFLESLESESIAVVTSMHLVEHLPFDVLVALIDQALRVLARGGALVLETPNPENIVMSTQWFYLDPTHRNPIPPALLSWLVSSRGFEAVTVENLTLNRGLYEQILELSSDIPGAAQINKLAAMLNAAPDYAVLARKG